MTKILVQQVIRKSYQALFFLLILVACHQQLKLLLVIVEGEVEGKF